MALLPVVQRVALPVIQKGLSAAPSLVDKIAKMIGSAPNPSAILAAARSNPVMTGLTLYQLGEIGTDAYQTLIANHPEVGEALEGMVFAADEITSTFVGDLSKYREELELVEDAARFVGGLGNLIKLRNALNLDPKFYALKMQLNDMGYRA